MSAEQPLAPKTIHVRNIPYKTDGKGLGDAFSRFGPVAAARIGTTRFRGQKMSAGYGFVEFKTEEGYRAALDCKDKIEVEGRTAFVRPARARKPQRRDTIFVRGIPESVDDNALKASFSKYNVVEVRLIRKDKPDMKGFGFIQLDTEEAVKKALDENKTIELGGGQSEVKMARPRAASSFRRRRPSGRRQSRRAPRALREPKDAPAQAN